MPSKNSKKLFTESGYYHVYNRGVEKRTIFLDERDYKTFLYFLKFYLDPDEKINQKTGLPNLKNLSGQISLMAYCLLPNHFHLLIKQAQKDSTTKLIRAIATNYVTYFNKRYNRVGPLFQGVYKAVAIDSDEQFLHVSRYIHQNPLSLARVRPSRGSDPLAELIGYPYSSLGDYLGNRHTKWVKTNEVLSFFADSKALITKQFNSYKSFMQTDDEENEEYQNLFLDSDDP